MWIGSRRCAAYVTLVALLVYSNQSMAANFCMGPDCCLGWYSDEYKSASIGLARIESVIGSAVSISLLDDQVFCTGGYVCSEVDFPSELLCDDGVANEEAWRCEDLSAGDSGLVLVDEDTRLFIYFIPVVGQEAMCEGGVPVDFALAQSLRQNGDCEREHIQNGYFKWCDDTDSCSGCSGAGGKRMDFLPFMVVAALLRRKRYVS